MRLISKDWVGAFDSIETIQDALNSLKIRYADFKENYKNTEGKVLITMVKIKFAQATNTEYLTIRVQPDGTFSDEKGLLIGDLTLDVAEVTNGDEYYATHLDELS